MQKNSMKLAVLFDADNIPARHARAIMDEIASFGEPALRRVYGDWSSEHIKGWGEQVLELGLVAHQETANTRGKNASDIGLVIDAMDILHTDRFDGFVLVSSDSDFTALANRIREHGLSVFGIGKGQTPDSLRNACNRFIFLENIAPDEDSARCAAKDIIGGIETDECEDAERRISQAIDQIEQEDEWHNLGHVGNAVIALYPDFDSRTYGESKLSNLVNRLGFETKRGEGNQILVRRKAA